MNKKIAAFIALLLGIQSVALADSFQANLIAAGVSTGTCSSQSVQGISGSLLCWTLTDGAPFLTVDVNGDVGIKQSVSANNVSSTVPVAVPVAGQAGLTFDMVAVSPTPYNITSSSTFVPVDSLAPGATLKGMTITCLPNNPTDPNTLYSQSSPITGGTVTLNQYAASGITTLHTMTFPDSPVGGPYVNFKVDTFTPVTLTPHSTLFAAITAVPVSSNQWVRCEALINM